MATGNEKKFELKIGKTGIFVVVMGMTAFLCASFLFGVNVGQNMETYPEKIASLPQRALALVWRPAKIKLTRQDAASGHIGNSPLSETQHVAAAQPEENIDLTYHQTLTSKKGVVREDAFVEKKPVIPGPINDEENQKGTFHIDTRKENTNDEKFLSQNQSETRMKDVQEPVKQKESLLSDSKRQTSSSGKNVGKNETGTIKDPLKEKEIVKNKEAEKAETSHHENSPVKHKFIIQVASLRDKSTAYKMNKDIASLGFNPKIIKTEIKGKGVLYRVVVSDIKDREQARKAAKKISAKTKTNCMIKNIEIKTKEN